MWPDVPFLTELMSAPNKHPYNGSLVKPVKFTSTHIFNINFPHTCNSHMLGTTYVKDYSAFVLAKVGNDLIFMNWKLLSYDHKCDRKLQPHYESADTECVCRGNGNSRPTSTVHTRDSVES